MSKTNLPNDVASGVPNVNNLTAEQAEYERLYSSLTRTQSGEGTFGPSASSGLSYTTNSYPSDTDVFNKGEEGLLNMFAKYILVDYLVTGEEFNEVVDEGLSDVKNYTESIFNTGDSDNESVRGGIETEYIGKTIDNRPTNGDFSNGTTGFSPLASTLSVSSQVLSITGDGSGVFPRATQDIDIGYNTGDEIFVYMLSEFDNADATQHIISLVGRGGGTEQFITKSNDGIGVKSEVYGSVTAQSDWSNGINYDLYAQYADAATANGKVQKIYGETGIFLINKTTEGLTDAEALNIARQGYHDGFTDVANPSQKVVGKNLFPDKDGWEQGRISGASGANATSDITIRTKEPLPISTLETFNASVQDSNYVIIALYFYTSSGVFVGFDDSVSSISPLADRYRATLRRDDSSDITIDVLDNALPQLEKGLVVTEYEKPTGSQQEVTTTLGSVPSAQDSAYRNGDKAWKKDKQTDIHELLSGDIDFLTNGTNVQFIVIGNDAFNGIIENDQFTIDGSVRVEGFGPEVDNGIDTAGNEHKFDTTSTQVRLAVPLGTYANIAAAQAALTGTKIRYQLASPVQEDITVKSQVEAIAGGTTYSTSDTFNAELNNVYALTQPSQVKLNTSGIIENGLKVAPIQNYDVASVDASTITLPSYQSASRILFRLNETVTGSPVQVSYNGTSYDLKEIDADGTEFDVTSISGGLKEVYFDGVNFIYAPKGGGTTSIIQHKGQSTISSTTLDIDVTALGIEDYTQCAVETMLSGGSTSVPSDNAATGHLTSNTNLRIQLGALVAASLTIRYVIHEFRNAKSVQTGEFTPTTNNAENSITISEVKSERCMAYTTARSSITTAVNALDVLGWVSSDTQFTAFAKNFVTPASTVIRWYVIETK